MVLSVGIIAGLVAMLCWGIADFLQAVNVKKIGSLKTMFFGNSIGILLTLPFIFYFLFLGKLLIDFNNLVLLFIAGVIDVVAVYYFLRSFEIGDASVVAPISASYSLVTVFLAIIFLKETLSSLKIISIFVICLGIVLTSADFTKLKKMKAAKGVKESLVPLFIWGVYFFIIGIATKNMVSLNQAIGLNLSDAKVAAAINIFFFTTIINSLLMALFAFLKQKKVSISDLKVKNVLLIFLINFVLYTTAWVAVSYGISQDLVSIVTSVSSLYPALVSILAVIFFKEKLVLNQKIGIVTVLAGIFLISL
jgi:drug/metabolite transporter (DMT)-like permease